MTVAPHGAGVPRACRCAVTDAGVVTARKAAKRSDAYPHSALGTEQRGNRPQASGVAASRGVGRSWPREMYVCMRPVHVVAIVLGVALTAVAVALLYWLHLLSQIEFGHGVRVVPEPS